MTDQINDVSSIGSGEHMYGKTMVVPMDIDENENYPVSVGGGPLSTPSTSDDYVFVSQEKYEGDTYIRMNSCSEAGGVYGKGDKNAPDSCSPYAIYFSKEKGLTVVDAKYVGGKQDVAAELSGTKYPNLVDDRLKTNAAEFLAQASWKMFYEASLKDDEADKAVGKMYLEMAYAVVGKQPEIASSKGGKVEEVYVDVDNSYLPSLSCVSMGKETTNDKGLVFEFLENQYCINVISEVGGLFGEDSTVSKGAAGSYSPYVFCLNTNPDPYTVYAIEGAPVTGVKEGNIAFLDTQPVYKIEKSERAAIFILGLMECVQRNNWVNGQGVDEGALNLVDEASVKIGSVETYGKELPEKMKIKECAIFGPGAHPMEMF